VKIINKRIIVYVINALLKWGEEGQKKECGKKTRP
jgi:hypothetical protein